MQDRNSKSTGRKRPHLDVEIRHFEEVCELLRHYSGLRFRQLTIFVAVNGGLLFALYRYTGPISEYHILGFTALGVVAATAFALLELRLHQYLDHYRQLVSDYEKRFALPHSIYDQNRRGWLLQGRIAVLLLILSTAGIWVLVCIMALANNASRV